MNTMTITINGLTQHFESVEADSAVCLETWQATPTMPRVMINHFSAIRNADKAGYCNSGIVKQDTAVEFENFSPFGVIEPINDIKPTKKEIKNLYKKPAVARKLA